MEIVYPCSPPDKAQRCWILSFGKHSSFQPVPSATVSLSTSGWSGLGCFLDVPFGFIFNFLSPYTKITCTTKLGRLDFFYLWLFQLCPVWRYASMQQAQSRTHGGSLSLTWQRMTGWPGSDDLGSWEDDSAKTSLAWLRWSVRFIY